MNHHHSSWSATILIKVIQPPFCQSTAAKQLFSHLLLHGGFFNVSHHLLWKAWKLATRRKPQRAVVRDQKSLKPPEKPKPTISSPRKKTESAGWICSYLAQHIMWLRPWAIGILSPTRRRQPFIIYIIKPKAARQGAANASAWECEKNSIHNH